MSLFQLKTTAKPQGLLVPKCEACGLYKKCRSPKMPVNGEGLRKILIVGEAPGEAEDQRNKPFVGTSGKLLEDTLRKLGVEMRRDCWVTNSLRCRPPNNEITNDKWVSYCRPNVVNTIKQLKPEKIILLGSTPIKSVVGWLWKPEPGGVFRWAGFQIPDRQVNAWICPTFHPAAMGYAKDPRVMQMLFEKHLHSALELEGTPYDRVPDLRSRVRLITDPEQAADHVHRFIDSGRAVAFDYETSHLRPEAQESRILSCSVSDGANTISYPWRGEVIAATKELLASKVRKIVHNASFEYKWTKSKLKLRIKNLAWDSMVNAHVLDNRKEICGLKFLSYAELGYQSYDDEIEPFRGGGGPFGENTLHKVPLNKLLLYGAYDALFTHELASKQAKVMGIEL